MDCTVGILEVNCPYSMRDVQIECTSEWQHHLQYLDCNNMLKKTHDNYHQIQGAMAAVEVDWCDFVRWTLSNMKIQRSPRDHWWSMLYVPQLESFYRHHIIHKEDFYEGLSDTATRDTEEEPFERYDHPARDLPSILHHVGPAAHYLRHW